MIASIGILEQFFCFFFQSKKKKSISEDNRLTSSFLFHLQGSLGGTAYSLFFLLFLAAPVKILDDHTDEHVEHEKANQQDEGDEVEQSPLRIILDWLRRNKT